MFYTNLDTWLGLHHSCFHVTSLVVRPCYWTFTGRAITSLSCMSRASIVYTSRTSSLFMGRIRLLSVGKYEREIRYFLMKHQNVHVSCTSASLAAMPVDVAPYRLFIRLWMRSTSREIRRNLKYHDQILIDFGTLRSHTLC